MEKKEYTSVNHIVKYIGIFGGVEILKTLANLSRGKITAYFLGPLGVGLIAIYQNILELIRSCTNIGLETAGIQQLSEISAEKRYEEAATMSKVIRTWSMAIALLGTMACIVLAPLLERLYFSETHSGYIAIMMLAPAAFFAPIAAGECSILKGTHKLKRVAVVELLGAVGTVICTLPIYWIMGVSGIIPALVLCITIEALVHLFFCIQVMPYRIDMFSADVWKSGIPLLKFGIPYALTAIMGAVTTTILYKIIDTTSDVAYYKTGYALIMYYVSIAFSSNSSDYFPRLAGICHDKEMKTAAVNNQIHTSFILTTPMVMAFLLAIPLIVVVLFTDEFMPIVSMCVMAGLFQLLRSVTLPMEYVSLAHGHSWMFLLLEGLYNIMTIAATFFLYDRLGMAGIGIALSMVGVANTAILAMVNRIFYNISISRRNWMTIAAGAGIVICIIVLCNQEDTALRFGAGIPLTLLAAAYSYLTLRKSIKE
ncbi:MAG: oligosaccharide flippase family protein [Bacteroidaceae bacterium]|nr:oligosaccharide flippase family protein [Bacteroidaceae bacterium]